MGKKLVLGLLLVFMLVITVQAEEAKFVQLAILNPCQLVPQDKSIEGLSLALLYAVNKDVSGVSLAIGINKATGDVKGLEWGLGNWVEGSAHAWQEGLINHVGGKFVGLQGGAVNVVKGDFTGLQDGLVNWDEGSVHGIQLGAFNYTMKQFVGIQAGLVNVSKGAFAGMELGAVNYVEGPVHGFQGGIINYAAEMHGLQIGLINQTKSLDGLQIGLGNYNGNKKPMEFMVLANWSF